MTSDYSPEERLAQWSRELGIEIDGRGMLVYAALKLRLRAMEAKLDAALDEADLPRELVETLFACLMEGTSSRPSDVAKRLGVPPATLTPRLSRMELRGWVVRVAVPGDRRSLAVEVTAAGYEAARESLVLYAAALRE
jgi:DNA-binding MarR family transcriptional regulator